VTPLEERVAALERQAAQRDQAMHDLASKVRAAERVAMRTDERLAALHEQLVNHIAGGGYAA
jgi:uncharacterized coiled-coil protein SlyX